MSLVGTRPPTVDEYEQYELGHRKRLMKLKDGFEKALISLKIPNNFILFIDGIDARPSHKEDLFSDL